MEEEREIDRYERQLLARAPAARRPNKEPGKPGVMHAINELFNRTFDWMDRTAPIVSAQKAKVEALEHKLTAIGARLDVLEASDRQRNVARTVIRDQSGRITSLE
jgi:hypothetical protein